MHCFYSNRKLYARTTSTHCLLGHFSVVLTPVWITVYNVYEGNEHKRLRRRCGKKKKNWMQTGNESFQFDVIMHSNFSMLVLDNKK